MGILLGILITGLIIGYIVLSLHVWSIDKQVEEIIEHLGMDDESEGSDE